MAAVHQLTNTKLFFFNTTGKITLDTNMYKEQKMTAFVRCRFRPLVEMITKH